MNTDGIVMFLGAGFSKGLNDTPIDLLKTILEGNDVDSETKCSIRALVPDNDCLTTSQFELMLSIVQRLKSQQRAGRPSLSKVQDPDILWRKLIAAVARITHFGSATRAEWVDKLNPLSNFFKNYSVTHVITTNYDLIADKAVLDARRDEDVKINNLPRYQYGYPVRGLYWKDHDKEPNESYVSWSRDEGRIQIYKLHGSANWAYCDYCKELDLAATRTELWSVQNWVDRPRCDCGSFYEPIIIPPVLNKGITNIPLFAHVWQKAEKALEAAKLVIFVGYSLPLADPLVSEMLATARQRSAEAHNGMPWRFCVIDPSCCTHARYRNVLGSGGRHYVTEFNEFNLGLLCDCCRSGGVPFGLDG